MPSTRTPSSPSRTCGATPQDLPRGTEPLETPCSPTRRPRCLRHGAPRMPSWDSKTPVEPRRPNPVDRHDLLHGYDKYSLEDAEYSTPDTETLNDKFSIL